MFDFILKNFSAAYHVHVNVSTGPPNIVNITSDTIVFEGNRTTLMCTAFNDEDAVSPLTIVWYNSKGIRLKSDDEHIVIYNTTDPVTGQVLSTLLFDPVNHTDSGEYICRAFNDKDCYTEDKTVLTVKCKYIRSFYRHKILYCVLVTVLLE